MDQRQGRSCHSPGHEGGRQELEGGGRNIGKFYNTGQANICPRFDMPLVTKETIRILERYVSLIEQAEDIKLPVPTTEDLDRIKEYWDLMPSEDETNNAFPVPSMKK